MVSGSGQKADSDSRARTHLANERTFLAWLRTGLSLMALGLGAARFLERGLVPGFPVTTIFALFLVVSGVVVTMVGSVHYSHGRDEIEAGEFRPSSRATLLVAALIIGAGALSLVLVVILRGHA